MTQDYDRADVDTLPQRLHERRLAEDGHKRKRLQKGSLSSTIPYVHGLSKTTCIRKSGKYPLSAAAASAAQRDKKGGGGFSRNGTSGHDDMHVSPGDGATTSDKRLCNWTMKQILYRSIVL